MCSNNQLVPSRGPMSALKRLPAETAANPKAEILKAETLK
jgi:hypothetical protein